MVIRRVVAARIRWLFTALVLLVILCISAQLLLGNRQKTVGKPSEDAQAVLFFSPLLGRKCGDDSTCAARERNAVASWALLSTAAAPGRFHIFVLVEQLAYCDPVVAATPHTTCVALPNCADPATGILTVSCIAREALTRGARLLRGLQFLAVLVNSDVIFTHSFVNTVAAARAALGPQFVLVGRRYDAPVTEMILSNSPPERMVRDAEAVYHALGFKHSVFGMDYFAFPATAFPSEFPPFLVGRYRWDNVLALELLMSGLPFVDATESVVCIHQGYVQNASQPNHIGRQGAAINAELTRAHSGGAHRLGRMDNADWRIEGACPHCRVVRQQPKSGWLLQAYKAAHPRSRALLLLFADRKDQVRKAVQWVSWLKERRFEHYSIVVCSSDIRNALRRHDVQAELLSSTAKNCMQQRDEAVQSMLRCNISPIVVFGGFAEAPQLLAQALGNAKEKPPADLRCWSRASDEKEHILAVQLAATVKAQEVWNGITTCRQISGTLATSTCVFAACSAL